MFKHFASVSGAISLICCSAYRQPALDGGNASHAPLKDQINMNPISGRADELQKSKDEEAENTQYLIGIGIGAAVVLAIMFSRSRKNLS